MLEHRCTRFKNGIILYPLVGSDLYAPVIVGLATGIAFIVVMASAIDIPLRQPSDFIGFTNELEQTKTFLSRYPDADVFVYLVRCTPLSECPGPTVEYVYEDSTNFAFLRIQVQPSERVVTFIEVHCGALNSERYLPLYGSTVQTSALVNYLKLDRCPK